MTYTEQQLAKIALWLDDPYGDGIRLEAIRNPSVERAAALTFVASGQRSLSNDEEVYINRGEQYIAKPANVRYLKRQQVI